MRSLQPNIGAVPMVAPAVHTGNNTGAATDLLGFESACLVVNTGAVAGDGDFSIKLQESDTTTAGDFADVAAEHLTGTVPATLEAASVYRLGYIGHRRYLRTVLTRNGGTSLALGAVLVKGHPAEVPVT
ncbi:hypothetical protein ROJ8625_00706 [Roseivivax jejudonensis]|uniref:Uncharacterized protein n=1 Tax=Roseivivax jejudonensis TaxID=1529041 RepID=A0A1X6YHU4_9RHOB|nr:hypothetical protein [Roseivivax jejudonensis]SLN20013.1 hypothetical protein ROJ8625_00706 [Roseivivax jejudonensis]